MKMLENFKNFFICKKKQIIFISCFIVFGIVLVLFSYLIYLTSNKKVKEFDSELISFEKEEQKEEVLETEEVTKTIFVDIKGEVNKPGVYELNSGSRVINAIESAEGFTSNAYTRNINLSKILVDEAVVIVNSISEIENLKNVSDETCECEEINYACLESEKETESEKVKIDGKININTASLEELTTLDGIGEAKANKIIEHRKTNGKFKNIEDLLLVSGIGESIYAKIKENITV